MPQKVSFVGTGNRTTSYVYAADGEKLRVTHRSSTEKRTDYVGDFIYENGSLKRLLVDGGYYVPGLNRYCFYLQDHQGNNRVVADQSGSVVQSNHYYPYGLPFAEGVQPAAQPYKYNGKELDTEYGLNLYDYEARYTDPALGRFTTVDPLAEKRSWVSPYSFVQNNPMNRIDPNGALDDWVKEDEIGKYKWMDDVTSAKNTPKGYTYVGSEDKDILTNLGADYTFSQQSSNELGYIASDAQLGRYAVSHAVNVHVKTNVIITADVSYSESAKTEKNLMGKKFEGINIYGSVVSTNTSVDGTLTTYADLSVDYGRRNYTSSFMEPKKPYVKATGSEVSVTNILLPASNLSSSNRFTGINISGGFWVTNSAGFRTPVVYYPAVIIPRKFNHIWNFSNRR